MFSGNRCFSKERNNQYQGSVEQIHPGAWALPDLQNVYTVPSSEVQLF